MFLVYFEEELMLIYWYSGFFVVRDSGCLLISRITFFGEGERTVAFYKSKCRVKLSIGSAVIQIGIQEVYWLRGLSLKYTAVVLPLITMIDFCVS